MCSSWRYECHKWSVEIDEVDGRKLAGQLRDIHKSWQQLQCYHVQLWRPLLHRLLINGGGKDHVVGCAFGPGIAVEMMLFQKSQGSRSGSERGFLGGALMAEDVDWR